MYKPIDCVTQRTDLGRIKPEPPVRRASVAEFSAKAVDMFITMFLGVMFMCTGACAVLGAFEIAGLIAGSF